MYFSLGYIWQYFTSMIIVMRAYLIERKKPRVSLLLCYWIMLRTSKPQHSNHLACCIPIYCYLSLHCFELLQSASTLIWHNCTLVLYTTWLVLMFLCFREAIWMFSLSRSLSCLRPGATCPTWLSLPSEVSPISFTLILATFLVYGHDFSKQDTVVICHCHLSVCVRFTHLIRA